MRTTLRIIIPFFFSILISCSNSQEKIKSEPLEINTEKDYGGLVEEIETNNEIYNCEKLPSSFPSYEVALDKIHNAKFKYSEKISITNSTWLKGASYFSCDGFQGYLIIKTDKQYYIHSNLPKKIWKDFKDSSSKGKYYINNIKGRYQFLLN